MGFSAPWRLFWPEPFEKLAVEGLSMSDEQHREALLSKLISGRGVTALEKRRRELADRREIIEDYSGSRYSPTSAFHAVASSHVRGFFDRREVAAKKRNHAIVQELDGLVVSIGTVVNAIASSLEASRKSLETSKSKYFASTRDSFEEWQRQMEVTYAPSNPLSQAMSVAAAADVAVVFVGLNSCEGIDRFNLSLPDGQDELVKAIASVQKTTIVVVNAPGAVLMPWATAVDSIVCTFLPGQEDGNAIADVIFGEVNPSGRLPVTFPASEDQIPVDTVAQYPGINNNAAYSEELLIGYRWYDANDVEPLFPFGHGLSYTTFDYEKLSVSRQGDSVTVSFQIKNSGPVTGWEVAQLYIAFPETAFEPPQILRGFQKVGPISFNQMAPCTFYLSTDDFSIWDVYSNDWKVIRGAFTLRIGSSSRDIRLTYNLNY